MINSILSMILKLVLSLLRFILNIVLLPLTLVINSLFPDVGNYIHYFYDLLDEHLIRGLRFAREFVLNITGINRNLFGILALIPLTYLTFNILNARC